MIKNNLIYGFNQNGVIGYTKNAIGDMSVLVHEYAHTYFNNEAPIDVSQVESITMLRVSCLVDVGQEFYDNVRFEPLFEGKTEMKEYYCEKFATIIGVLFKRIQGKLPIYKSAEDMRKNLVKDVENVCSEELKAKDGFSIFIDVLKSMCGKQQQVKSVKSAKTITMEDIKKQAKKVCETETEEMAFVQGAIWALEQSGIKVAETETKVEEKVETPKEEKPKKATAKKATKKAGKPKKATKKAKVEDKPTFDVGDEFDNGWLIVEYLGKGKYKIIDNEGNELVKTEKEIDEA